MDLKKTSERYRRELLDNVLPFWVNHSLDRECGGYFTCLNPVSYTHLTLPTRRAV